MPIGKPCLLPTSARESKLTNKYKKGALKELKFALLKSLVRMEGNEKNFLRYL